MRPLLAFAVLSTLALAAPLAAAHEDDAVNHFTLIVDDLAPGESREVHMTYERGPLREGWIMIFVGGIVGEPANLELEASLHNETVNEWAWTSGNGAINLHTFELDETSQDYVVTLTNPGDEPVKFFFYFDQSCECLAKPMPFPGSYALFNFDFYPGETAWFHFETPENMSLQYTVARRTGDGGTWPEDFSPVKSYPQDALPNGTLTWNVTKEETYYIMTQATKGNGSIEPRLFISQHDQPTEEKPVPAPAAPAVVLAALAAAALAAVRRRRVDR